MRRAGPVLVVCAVLAVRCAAAQCVIDPNARFNKVEALPIHVVFPPPGPPEFEAGYTAERTYEVDVHPIAQNRLVPWHLCFAAEAPFFPTTTGSSKPASDLEWSLDGAQWAQVTLSPQTVGPTFVGRQLLTVRVRARLRYDDLPATYGPLPLLFIAAH